MDMIVEEKKKEYALKVIELLVGRSYPLPDISDIMKKHTIMEEAEVFYRDHIKGVTGGDASYHNTHQRFPNLNEKIRNELSSFAEKMNESGDDLSKMQQVIKDFGITIDFYSDKFKAMLNGR
jgi:hypothetical protein